MQERHGNTPAIYVWEMVMTGRWHSIAHGVADLSEEPDRFNVKSCSLTKRLAHMRPRTNIYSYQLFWRD